MNPHQFLRRCFECNQNVEDRVGSSLKNGAWKCVACTQKSLKRPYGSLGEEIHCNYPQCVGGQMGTHCRQECV